MVVVATAGEPTFSGNDVVVNLTGVTNQQYVRLTLTNVASATPVADAVAIKNAAPVGIETVRWGGRGRLLWLPQATI